MAEKQQKTDEEEIFEQYGIEDEDDKHRVKVLAAARHLAARKQKPAQPTIDPEEEKKKKRKSGRWGEE